VGAAAAIFEQYELVAMVKLYFGCSITACVVKQDFGGSSMR